MNLKIFDTTTQLGQAAAAQAAQVLRNAIAERGTARMIAATGASQFSFLAALTQDRSVDWGKVEMFHLDEYIGLPLSHPASFRKYLMERLITPTGMGRFHLLDGEGDPQQVCAAVGALISAAPIDLAIVGVGENGHIAFNDPPADFETEEPYIVVALDDACRRQQLGEGWFPSFEAVPTHAISMSVRQILKAHEIICIVPEARKAEAVRRCFGGPVSPLAPSSILQTHPRTTIYLDGESSKFLSADLKNGLNG